MEPKVLSEGELLKEINARTPYSYEALHKQLYKYLYIMALKIVDDEMEAEDAVKTVFINVYCSRRSVQFVSVREAHKYFTKAVKNQGITRRSRLKARKKLAWAARDMHGDESVDPVWDAFERKTRETQLAMRFKEVTKAMDTQDKRCLEAVKLYFIQELSTVEVAETLGVASQTALNLKAKGLRMLSRQFQEVDQRGGTAKPMPAMLLP